MVQVRESLPPTYLAHPGHSRHGGVGQWMGDLPLSLLLSAALPLKQISNFLKAHCIDHKTGLPSHITKPWPPAGPDLPLKPALQVSVLHGDRPGAAPHPTGPREDLGGECPGVPSSNGESTLP